MSYRRDSLILALLALAVGTLVAMQFGAPGYTDAYYYANAARRLVVGNGLTDAAIFTYIGAPPGLPVPGHLYWMPLTSLVAAAGMLLGGPNFDAAQSGFVLLYAGVVVLGFQIGALLGKSRRIAWLAGLLTLFSGFYMPWWLNTTTIAPFGLAGGLSLLAAGLGRRSDHARWYALAGACAALAHLTRADGLLLLPILIVVALWPGGQRAGGPRLKAAAFGLAAYGLVMLPWFGRNLAVLGSILPTGGLDTAWMRSYDEITAYPPGATLTDFLAWGAGNILRSRWDALVVNAPRFIVEQGMVVLTPLMLLALWRRRRDPLLSAFILYAPALHLVMTFLFAFPGPRGGLFHSASALIPFWAALGALGLDDLISWIAPRRRWKPGEAKVIFGITLVIIAGALSYSSVVGKTRQWEGERTRFEALVAQARLTPNDIVMINDPPALYYYTGIAGVVLPDSPPGIIPDIAARYGVTHVILDSNRPPSLDDLWSGNDLPAFLEDTYSGNGYRVYRIKAL